MALIASAVATLLHEGLGHGVVAWLRGDVPTELTSNHLSSVTSDHWVEAGGTLVNLFLGAVFLLISRASRDRANIRYFFWILAALNLLPGAGYFLYSGIFGVGDWQQVIQGLPHQAALRTALTIFGAALYVLVVRVLAADVLPFCSSQSDYNVTGRLPYAAAGLFSCVAGALDPLGLKLFLVATVAAAFGGSSGLLWADSFFPGKPPARTLAVSRQPGWWVAAVVFGLAYIVIVGRGIRLPH